MACVFAFAPLTEAAQRKVPLPRARPAAVTPVTQARPATPVMQSVAAPVAQAFVRATPKPPAPALAYAQTSATSPVDLSSVKLAIKLAQQGREDQATQAQQTISDPLAKKLVEWAILRSKAGDIGFARSAAFINANPSWPGTGFLRRRAEAALWHEPTDAGTVRAFFAKDKPTSAKGRLALARALLAQGDRTAAQFYVREAWRLDAMSKDLEDQALAALGSLLSAADHKLRMDMRLYAEDVDGGLRAAARAGAAAQTIARARVAVVKKAKNAKALLDAVPAEARRDAGYMFSRIQWHRRNDQIAQAAELMMAAPRQATQIGNTDEWWVERRLIARKLLDENNPRAAYAIARDSAVPDKENYRVDQQFTAGWIALRFLNDPTTAMPHFARITQVTRHPISLARAGYWQGRTAEALGRMQDASNHYATAARYSFAYYGQIARARLGMKDMALRPPPEPSPERRAALGQLEVVRAVQILYAIEEADLVIPIVTDLASNSNDVDALTAIGNITAHYKDARATLLLGKTALARGLPLEHFAFPTFGLPEYRAIGPAVELPTVYAIARQESTFNQRVISVARAIGLMQVTPAAGRYVAKKFSVTFNEQRLRSDPIYNVQLGAAELGDLIKDYNGSYVLAFVGYNAGRGRVRDWIARFGDPRDPKVDPIDWVERIPFSETRNYVERVLENVQVYRARFGAGTRLLIEADLRRGATQ
jgi:soluble lytic murein transglycosylase